MVDRLFPRARGTQPQPAATASAQGSGAAAPDPKLRELQLRRDDLARELAERQWDLGGVTYEMAIRDHFRMDVLVRLAARLQEIDAELAEVERLLRLEAGGASGECPSCRAPHSRGALYCWSCGAQLMATVTQQPGSASPTLVKAP